MALSPGTRLGHYDVTALLGEGGMGQVWQATDTQLNREVALKILPDAFADDPDRLARFKREAQILASLNHPNIAQLYGIEEAEGTRALVLELVEGPTLADRIAKGPIPLDEALPIAKQIAEALEAAHEAGVIHRDLKPANIKVREDGTVKVLDFGLAKALDPAPDADPSQSPTLTAAATQMGVIMGTAAYMSPEQAKGKVVDKRADVWAFGAVFYEMLTGRRAFAGDDVTDILAAVVRAEPEWSMLPASTPPVLRRLLRRCLSKDHRQRLQHIGDGRLDLEDGSADVADVAGAAPTRPGAVPWSLSAITALALIAVVGWATTRSPSLAPASVTRWAMRAPDELRGSLGFSPDGTRLVFDAGSTRANGLLYVRSMTQLDAVPIRGTDGGTLPFFSPDGTSIGFFAARQLKRVVVEGGPPVVLAEAPDPLGGSWGSDGSIIYAPNYNSGLWRVSASGGDAEELTTPDVAAGELGHWWPQILPGDEAALFTAYSSPIENARIVVMLLMGGDERTLVTGGVFGRYVSSGHLLYAQGEVLFAAPFDRERLQLTGPPVPVLEDVAFGSGSGFSGFTVSENGSLAYAPASTFFPNKVLAWVDRRGVVESASEVMGRYTQLSLSPAGTRVAVTVDGLTRSVWVFDVNRETMEPLTLGEGNDFAAYWTPDGGHVIYASEQLGGVFELYRIRADGTEEPEPLYSPATGIRCPPPWLQMVLWWHSPRPGMASGCCRLTVNAARSRFSGLRQPRHGPGSLPMVSGLRTSRTGQAVWRCTCGRTGRAPASWYRPTEARTHGGLQVAASCSTAVRTRSCPCRTIPQAA